jgi:hypothetical protein
MSLPIDLVLIRHGQSEGNAAKRLAEKGDDTIDVERMIVEMLELDPRPASQKRKMPPKDVESIGLRFAFTLFDFDVKWEIRDGKFAVLDLEDLVDGRPRDLVKKKN